MTEEFQLPNSVCFQCRFHCSSNKNPACPGIWYDQYCSASMRTPWIDSTTGEMGGISRCVCREEYQHCSDVNNGGNCPNFIPKSYSSWIKYEEKLKKQLEKEMNKFTENQKEIDNLVRTYRDAVENGTIKEWENEHNGSFIEKTKARIKDGIKSLTT